MEVEVVAAEVEVEYHVVAVVITVEGHQGVCLAAVVDRAGTRVLDPPGEVRFHAAVPHHAGLLLRTRSARHAQRVHHDQADRLPIELQDQRCGRGARVLHPEAVRGGHPAIRFHHSYETGPAIRGSAPEAAADPDQTSQTLAQVQETEIEAQA
ncbi:hypothetical protein Pan241w_40510 [Gimesia alba]|uniref:Uncharacterized protein n=1 Tax=Gimesia alba TaxID=2527973 RepID=A0A517RJ98_9PLAN|nr:hypothetical protein Pan241w_40510 [Gimesia alba]